MSVPTPATAQPTTNEQHGLKAHSDGGWTAADGSYIPVQTRSGRFTSVNHADFPEVTGFEVDWKLSPVAVLKPLIDDALDGSAYEYEATDAPGATVEWIDRADPKVGSAGIPEDRASANAWSTFEKALAITVSSEERVEVTVDRSGLGTTARAAHTVITATPNSRGHVVLSNTGDALLAENVEIVVGDGAELTVVSVQQWAGEAIHLASHFARVGRDAKLRHIIVSLSGAVVRVNPSVHLSGEGAGQHLEQRVYLHHEAAHTKGRVNYKGALQGKGARTVWVGDVLIGRNASGTDSYEQNRNLVLSEGTRADSIPNLEIETGDILGAGHASATGRFDDEQLFYLQARGISEEEARRLVVLGFLSEIVQKMDRPELEARLQVAIDAEIAGVAA
jgi:Fe-S cluster assembly protein SufD